MKSYVRIHGPPLLKAIKALEEVAVDMSKATNVKFSHRCVPYPTRYQSDERDWNNYLKKMQQQYVDCYEPVKIISKAEQMLGEYDFMYEWEEDPSMEKVQDLIKRIDEALGKLGVYYTLTTK